MKADTSRLMVAICLGLLNIPFQRAYADSNGQFDSLQALSQLKKARIKRDHRFAYTRNR